MERASGRGWAVDSWYGANGSPASVWPLEMWLERKDNEKNREDRGAGVKEPFPKP